MSRSERVISCEGLTILPDPLKEIREILEALKKGDKLRVREILTGLKEG